MKKRVLLAVAAALCLLAGCKKSEPAEYEKGMENLEKQKYEQAVQNFEDAIQKGEESILSWRGIGLARTGQGNYEKAEEAYSTALGITEKKEKALQRDLYLYLADAQYHQEDYQGCIETCSQLLESDEYEDGYFLRGSCYLRRNEYKKAENDFKKVISHNAGYQDYLDIYRIYQECGLSADGEEYLESALDLKGNSAKDHYQRGRIYYYLSEYKDAEKSLKTALKKGYEQAALYLGKVYAEEQDYEQAVSMYKKCLETEHMKAEAYNGLACCAAAQGDYTKALSYIEKGLKTKDLEMKQVLLFNQIVFFEESMDFVSAKEKVSEYLERYPQDKDALREYYFLQTR